MTVAEWLLTHSSGEAGNTALNLLLQMSGPIYIPIEELAVDFIINTYEADLVMDIVNCDIMLSELTADISVDIITADIARSE